MWCGILGPLTVRGRDGEPLTIAGPARRLLFVALVSRAGRTVPPEVLIEDLWGHVPPRTAAKTLQSHVVRLRDDLGRDPALVTDRSGYRLDVGADDVDAGCFEAGVRDAADLARGGDAVATLAALDDALALWRGDAYEEFADAPFCVGERLRLFELRVHAEEERTEAALTLGRSGELVADLEKRVATAPYRERTWEQLILALYRADRQADALGAYRRARTILTDELGVEPGTRLRDLERRVLEHDPALLSPPALQRPATEIAPRPGLCPYRGLASYGEGDGELFVGRERLTAELVGRLADNHVLAVVGASGTGKSSLLRAGLVPALRGGALPGSAAWRVAVLMPVDAVDEPALGELDVVVLDQAEDLFGRLTEGPREALVDRLAEFAASGGRLVFALRADFYGRLTEVQPLAAYAQAATLLVGPLREDELRRVVIEPAERVGLQIEPALVDAVLDDVTGQPAALPLLSAALVRTWENREGRRLTVAGYRHGGGVASALEATAEDTYARLPDDHRRRARALLVRLAAWEGGTWVRRPVRRTDAAPDEPGEQVLAALARARLVSVAQERVEITHDALLAHWPRLRGWLEERVLAADLLDHLDVATRAWADTGEPASDLYRGPRLQSALDWRADHPDDISAAEGRFLDASAAAADAELTAARARAHREARGRRRLRAVAIGLAAMVVLAAVGVGVALHERGSASHSATRARAAALTADARRLAALSLTAPDIATSSLLAVAAYRLEDSSDTRGALLSAVERNQTALWRVQTAHRVQAIATNPAGSRVAVIDNRRQIYVYDTTTRRTVASFFSHGFMVTGMSADGRQLVVSGADPHELTNHNRVAVWDVAGRRRVRVLTEDDDIGQVLPVMSQDGRWLAVLSQRHTAGQVLIRIYDARDWSAPPRTLSVPVGPLALAVSATALAVQEANGSVTVWSLPTLHVIRRISGIRAGPPTSALAVSPDGSSVALPDGADPTRLSAYPTGGGAPTSIPTQPQGISALAYSPDGSQLAVASYSGSLNVYRTADGALVDAFAGESGPVLGVCWSGTSHPTGLYSSGLDSQLVSWSVGTGRRLITETGPDMRAPDRAELFGNVALGMTPQDVPSAQERGYAVDIRTGHVTAWGLGLPDNGYLNQLVASHDGRIALVSTEDPAGHSTVAIRDLAANRQLGILQMPPDAPGTFAPGFNAAISPDGRRAYANLGASRIGVFAVPSGRYLRSFTITYSQPDAGRIVAIPWQFAPDGKLVFGGADTGPHPTPLPGAIGPNDSAPPNPRLGLVDPRTGRLTAQTGLGDIDGPTALAWSPDKRLLAVGTFDGTLTLYDATTLHRIATAGVAEPGPIRTVSFAPTGHDLVSAGTGGALNFWSVPELDREASPVFVGNGANNGGMFAWYLPSGRIVGFAPDVRRADTDLQRWFTFDAAPAALARTACGLAGGDITRAQWARYVGDRPYRRVCT